jgi:hypothetical protein
MMIMHSRIFGAVSCRESDMPLVCDTHIIPNVRYLTTQGGKLLAIA